MGNFSSNGFYFLATRYHRQIPNQPFVVLTSHHNERYYLLVRNDDDDCFKVRQNLGFFSSYFNIKIISFH